MDELRELLEKTDDKFAFIADENNFIGKNITIGEFKNLVNEFLTDEEKIKCLYIEYLIPFGKYIIQTISNKDILYEIISNVDLINKLTVDKYYIKEMIISLSIEKKVEILNNYELMNAYMLERFDIREIVKTLNDEEKIDILDNSEFFKNYNLNSYDIVEIIKGIKEDTYKIKAINNFKSLNLGNFEIKECISSLSSDENKILLLSLYSLNKSEILSVVKTFSLENKLDVLLNDKYNFNTRLKTLLLGTFNNDELIDFFNKNKEFIKDNNIKLYRIFECLYDRNQKLDFIYRLDEIECEDIDKVKAIALLKKNIKDEVDITKINDKYKYALELEVEEDFGFNTYGTVKVDFNKDLEIYKGLDDIITINAQQIKDDERNKMLKICKICPNIQISNNLIGISSVQEYINSEKWIDEILENIDESWSNIEKIAYIDHQIGKKISYSPDFDTEVFNDEDARALWKIINSGYGVCNGIANVEKYILSKLKIDAEIISSGRHSFLRLKEVEIKDENGNLKKGDTILDPTWNLAAHRFNAMPNCFCKSYESIKKCDIDSNGIDHHSHENSSLEDVTLELSDKELRTIFKNIGLADRNGVFPIKKLFDRLDTSFDDELSMEDNIFKKLKILREYNREFFKSPNSTMSIMRMLLEDNNLEYNNCVINRVYRKEDDKNRKVNFYIYFDFGANKKTFFVADEKLGNFVKMGLDDFEKEFEAYDFDIKRNGGVRAWEGKITTIEDLNRSSGRVEYNEGEER